MKCKSIFLSLCLCLILTQTFSQKKQAFYQEPEVIPGVFVKKTVPLRDFVEPDFDGVIVKGENLGEVPNPFQLNPKRNDKALPQGIDPALQRSYAPARSTKALNLSFDGIGYSNVNPPDPAMDVSDTHIIQMINGNGGAYFQIFDKTGGTLQAQTYFDSFTGIGGLGDPIVIYDQLADRWMMTEFAAGTNTLIVAITQTADPLGSWYVYSYTTPIFPDYPKYAMWPNAYVVTTNEQSGGPNPGVYAMDRASMLVGNPGSIQRFVVNTVPGVGFQVLTPVDLNGDILPPANEPALLWRMVDDGWDSSIAADRLDLFEFDIDFVTPANTTITLTQSLDTAPFDTDFCGYGLTPCIDQPGTIDLYALNQMLMNKIHYRNFNTHESMVISHVTDVTGNDEAGVRWYEIRRTTGNWFIHQQSTYSPDNDSRWMSSIAINEDGSIGLAYNTTSPTLNPSIKYTGRSACDPLNTMTEPETTLVAGSASNGSSRYGDYASMHVDPTDQSFWFTGQYNPATNWSTRIGNFDIAGAGPNVLFNTDQIDVNEQDAFIDNNCLDYQTVEIAISLCEAPTVDPTVSLTLSGSATAGEDYLPPSNLTATLTAPNYLHVFSFDIYDDAYVESPEDIIIDYTLNANGGNAVPGVLNQTLTINIESEDVTPQNSIGNLANIFSEDFESNTLNSFTTINPSGDTPWGTGDEATAQTSAFDIPAFPTGTYAAFINDDDCDCDQDSVLLVSPTLDLSNLNTAALRFDYYFENNVWQGNQEDLDVLISTNGGVSYSLLEDLAGTGMNWITNKVINLNAYAGMNNITIAFKYSDGTGWLYGAVVDNINIEGESPTQIQVLVNDTEPTEEYLGPNKTVHFYDQISGNIMLSLINTSAHDFGCTTVSVDRPGDTPSALVFSTNDPTEYAASKSFKILHDNPSTTNNYEIELYYEEAEVAAWETATGNLRDIMEVINVDGDNSINDVNPTNAITFDISYHTKTLDLYNADVVVVSNIPAGFSGVGLGKPVVDNGTCNNILTNTWVGPTSGNWNDNPSNWSLNVLPNQCHHIVIPNGVNVRILAGNSGAGFTIDIADGADLEVDQTATLDIVAPN